MTRTKDGLAEYLNCEFEVTEGPYTNQKFQGRFVLQGTDRHTKTIERSIITLKSVLDAVFDLDPSDKSPEARRKRTVPLEKFSGLCFVAKIGVEKGKPRDNGSGDCWPDKNFLITAITRDSKDWKAPPPQQLEGPVTKPRWASDPDDDVPF